MATAQATIDLLLGQFADTRDEIVAKKMFGEFGLFCQGRMIAIVGDEQLFFKPTEKGRALFPNAEEVAPYPGAKPCLLVPRERWNDRKWLAQLALATASELPLPKVKKKKPKA